MIEDMKIWYVVEIEVLKGELDLIMVSVKIDKVSVLVVDLVEMVIL